MFVRGVAELAEAFVSVKRLQKFLESDEMLATNTNDPIDMDDDVVISVTNLTANWSAGKENHFKSDTVVNDDKIEEIGLRKIEQMPGQYDTLKDINVTVKKGSLVGIIGPVGSGESLMSLSTLVKDEKKFLSFVRKKFVPPSLTT